MAAVCLATLAFGLAGCTGSGSSAASPSVTNATARTTGDAPASRFVSPSGSDAGACTAQEPCLTIERAYRVAGGGEVIEVAGGAYGPQVVPSVDKASSEPVVIRPADGASVETAGLLTITAQNVEVRDLAPAGVFVTDTSDVVLRDLDTRGYSAIVASRNVSVIGGDFGPVSGGADALQIKREPGHPNPDRILIDGVRFHDVVPAGQSHTDCIQVGGATNLTIRNSTFERCGHSDIIMGTFNGGVFGTALIENNFFGPTTHSYWAVHAEAAAVDLTFRYNSIGDQGVLLGTDEGGGARNVRVVGNVGALARVGAICQPTAVYAHNVWTNAACGPTDVEAPQGFVDKPALDYRLTPDAAANGHGMPGEAPLTDIFGTTRDQSAPDAGAAER